MKSRSIGLLGLSPVIVFCAALLIRLLYNSTAARGYMPSHDALAYQNIALSILNNHCYCLLQSSPIPTVSRAPFWPALIAFIYSLFGTHNQVTRLFLCFVGSGTCALIYFFARDLFGKRTGLIAGCIAAIYPFLFMYDSWMYAESLYTFLLFAVCYILYRIQIMPQAYLMVLAGLLLALAALTRPNGLFVFVLIIIWAFIAFRTGILAARALLKTTIVISSVFLVLVFPWSLRNYTVAHAIIPIAIGDGTVLAGAYNDKVVGKWYENGYYEGLWLAPEEDNPAFVQTFSTPCASTCEVERDNAYRASALQWIERHPDRLPLLSAQHFINFWQISTKEADLSINRYPERLGSQVTVTMVVIMTPIVFLLAFGGIVITRKRWREVLFLYLIIASTIIQCMLLYGSPRFRAPIEPIFLVFTAIALHWFSKFFLKYMKIFRFRPL